MKSRMNYKELFTFPPNQLPTIVRFTPSKVPFPSSASSLTILCSLHHGVSFPTSSILDNVQVLQHLPQTDERHFFVICLFLSIQLAGICQKQVCEITLAITVKTQQISLKKGKTTANTPVSLFYNFHSFLPFITTISTICVTLIS